MSFDPDELRQRRLRAGRARRRRQAAGDVATLGGILLALLFWLAALVLPLILMLAAIRFLWMHA